MPKTFVITGSTSGMGLASKQLLEQNGARVIGVSHGAGADITADLSTEAGVDFAIGEIRRLCGDRLDGIFANAGIDSENAPVVFYLNFFGIVRMLEALQPLLQQSGDGRVLINASNSVVITPGIPGDVVEALLEFNMPKALERIAPQPHSTYQVSKTAITRWARKAAVAEAWAGSNISMNILAPGVVYTALIEKDMKDPRKAAGINMLPKPLGAFAFPENVASLVKFLLLDDSRFIVGQYIIIDGGSEAALKGDVSPATWDISLEAFRTMLTGGKR